MPIVDVNGEPRAFRVDVRCLDPALMDPDEGMVSQHFPEMVSVRPPQPAMDALGKEQLPGQVGALAAWADSCDDFDRAEVTERSLVEYGRVSYRGVIPTCALELLDIRSQPLDLFRQSVDAAVRSDLDLPPVVRAQTRRLQRLAVGFHYGTDPAAPRIGGGSRAPVAPAPAW